MRFTFLLFSLWMLSACTSAPEVPASNAQTSTDKIRNNIGEAEKARNEYKALQAERSRQETQLLTLD